MLHLSYSIFLRTIIYLLWFDLSLKKFKIELIILYIRINILNKINNQCNITSQQRQQFKHRKYT
jgi:hypothetical protein